MKHIDQLTEEELRAEEQEYAPVCGRYVAAGYIEITRETYSRRPPSTRDWDKYVYFAKDDDKVLASIWAYNDDCARAYAENEFICDVDICLVRVIPRHAAGKIRLGLDSTGEVTRGIGFTLERDDEGLLIEDADFLDSLQVVINFMKERGLPEYMDEWTAWLNGAYYLGDQEIIDKIESVLDEFSELYPNYGLHLYAGYTHEWFKLEVTGD